MRAYMIEERRISDRIMSEMGVVVTDHPSLGEVIAFPYRRGGQPYAAKFRTKDKRFASTKDVSRGVLQRGRPVSRGNRGHHGGRN